MTPEELDAIKARALARNRDMLIDTLTLVAEVERALHREQDQVRKLRTELDRLQGESEDYYQRWALFVERARRSEEECDALAAKVARVEEWSAAPATTHEARATEGYWQAQEDARAALADPLAESEEQEEV